jgi:hypothetical protein
VFESLVVQGAVFSGVALLIFGGLTWFFFFSPVSGGSITSVPHPSKQLSDWLVALLGATMFMVVGGALWDTSMHIQTGEVPGGSDFLWPPHLVIYGGFLFAFLVALIAIGWAGWHGWRAGVRDPRRWVRANPHLGAVAVAATYALFSVPGDALWHELFGIDLTAWSPPHILLAVMLAIVSLSAVALWLRRPGARGLSRDLVTMILLAITLNELYIVGVLEWETPNGRTPFVAARPLWLYPLVGGALALVFLLLAKNLTRFRWSATTTALLFYAIRLFFSYLLSSTGSIAPLFPLVFLFGAFLLDVLPWERLRQGWARVLAQAAAFTAGYLPVAMTVLAQRNDLPRFDGLDWLAISGMTLVLGLFFAPLLGWARRRLAGMPTSA